VEITRDTTDSPGGAYQRHPQTGELTSVLFKRAAKLFSADQRAGLKHICQIFNAAGLTSVHDAIVSSQDPQTYQAAPASQGLRSLNPDSIGEGLVPGELTLRVYMLMWHEHFDALKAVGLRTGFGNEMLRISGIKLIADSAISGRTA